MIQNLFVSIVQTPALLVGLLAVLGLILQHKKTTQVIQGGIKTFAGFLILTGGAGILVNSLDPFAKMFQFSLGVQGVVPSNEAVVAIYRGKMRRRTCTNDGRTCRVCEQRRAVFCLSR